jgi:predicted phage terminase large subunit-like protein
VVVIDDPFKDAKEADSPTIREEAWRWFNKVIFARCHQFSAIVIVHTRWHEDDLIGRLVDPEHPNHDPKIASQWTYINIPAVVEDPALAEALGLTLEKPTDPAVIEQFGNKPMAALWENRKGLPFLAQACRLDKTGFYSLYMGKATPDDGDYFTKNMIREYQQHELPSNLVKYGASDHALTTLARNDANVLGVVGIDTNGVLWVLPDLIHDRFETDRIVEELIVLMKRHKPQMWWAEDEHISKGFGPFLRKRQRAEKAYTTVVPIRPASDMTLRARSIQGMMSLGQVRFPAFASWWPTAKRELLKFPFAAHDDFVSFMSLVGLGLDMEHDAPKPKQNDKEKSPEVGTIKWIKEMTRHKERRLASAEAQGGF